MSTIYFLHVPIYNQQKLFVVTIYYLKSCIYFLHTNLKIPAREKVNFFFLRFLIFFNKRFNIISKGKENTYQRGSIYTKSFFLEIWSSFNFFPSFPKSKTCPCENEEKKCKVTTSYKTCCKTVFSVLKCA